MKCSSSGSILNAMPVSLLLMFLDWDAKLSKNEPDNDECCLFCFRFVAQHNKQLRYPVTITQ